MSDPSTDSPQRRFAREVAEKLRDARHQALWAGGCVRDSLLGYEPKDYDVATNALPDEVREVFGRRRTIPVGAAFGVITVLGPKPAGQIEVATFRSDVGYTDGRHPDSVRFTDAEHDASRRDFTINGLFYDPLKEEVIDYVGGQADLRRQTLRAIGDPDARFNEDKLRMLRAVRFAATLGFEIEAGTRAAVERHAQEIIVVSAERIGAELRRMLTHASRVQALCTLRDTGLLGHVLKEVADLDAAEFAHRSHALARLDSPPVSLAVAAALPRHLRAPAGSQLCRRLRFTNEEGKHADWLLDYYELASRADRAAWPQVQRMLVHPWATDLLALLEAEEGASDAVRFFVEKLALPTEQLDPEWLATGDDLIAAGLRPGPHFGEILEAVRDEQLEGRMSTRAEAIAFAKRRLLDQ
ncbi:MAG: CCA tRNA nucleotidyltransferase [Planctomycetales bacterium]|nr:CCA tRNA nucleotidyltransferase [Planctomycetales bacterium]